MTSNVLYLCFRKYANTVNVTHAIGGTIIYCKFSKKNGNEIYFGTKDAFEIVLTIDDSSFFRMRTCFLVGEFVPSS